MCVCAFIYTRVPTQVLESLKRSYFRFLIYKATRKVLFLGFFDQMSYDGLILNATELFKIVDKFSFKEISKPSQISKFIHLDLKVHSISSIKTCTKRFNVLFNPLKSVLQSLF